MVSYCSVYHVLSRLPFSKPTSIRCLFLVTLETGRVGSISVCVCSCCDFATSLRQSNDGLGKSFSTTAAQPTGAEEGPPPPETLGMFCHKSLEF